MDRNFWELLEAQWAAGKRVCVGLDSKLETVAKAIPQQTDVTELLSGFNCGIWEVTHQQALAYKPNFAFYVAEGLPGLQALRSSIKHIHQHSPEVPVILDTKCADIGSSNEGWAKAVFDYFQADAVTVHNYFGAEAMEPFLKRQNKGVIALVRTSNPGAKKLQDLPIDPSGTPLYQEVARQVADPSEWNKYGNCGAVAGGTWPNEVRAIRQIIRDMWMLVPGGGRQGGKISEYAPAARNSRGSGIIPNFSSDVIFAFTKEEHRDKTYTDAAHAAFMGLHEELLRHLPHNT